ncbi:MAG: class I SAM-dependent methyltransferase, partial [Thermoguttaceae bacterium]
AGAKLAELLLEGGAVAADGGTDAALADRVTVLCRDYRDLTGTYDKLVSIEMIEAVGHQFFDIYFRACSERLKPEGLMLLQAITIPDQRYDAYRRGVDFIQRYIFPGGCLPSVCAVCDSVGRMTDMRLVHFEDLSPHYARTLALWRERFFANLDRVRALGFSDEFLRTWEYYFCYCEGAFRERATGNAQMLFAKPNCRREPVLSAHQPPDQPPAG